MSPEEVEKLLNKMLGQTDGCPTLTLTAWTVADELVNFYTQVDAEIYHNDPYSQQAPSECFGLHMKRWDGIKNLIDQNLPMAKRQYKRSFEPPSDEEIAQMMVELPR